jgi:hypothetical protein
MITEQHVITYPGFAEGKDAKKLFEDIQNRYGDQYEFHMLPFYEEKGSDRVVHSIYEHVDTLQDCMDGLAGDITILGKCGGTRVVASMDDKHIARAKKIALINMPWGDIDRKKLKKMIEKEWEGEALPDGSMAIARKGGRYIAEEGYLATVGLLNMMKRAKQMASLTQLFLVRGLDDVVVPPVRVEEIPGAIGIDIEGGDHHLLGESRQKVLGALAIYGVL